MLPQISIIDGLYKGPLYMDIRGYKMNTISVRWLPYSDKDSQNYIFF